MIPAIPVLSSDPEALALLISLRDHPDNQRDPALCKMFDDAIASITVSTNSSMATLASSPQQGAVPMLKEFPLAPFIRIDTSGQDGDNGHPGAAASHPEGKGINGTDSTPGKNARAINLRLEKKNEFVAAEWDDGSATLKVGDNTTSIVLRAVGGRGGRGGDGGGGGAGTKGARGADATRHSAGGNGRQGGNGGFGGNSGSGTNGGSGGAIKVYVTPDETDLLLLMNTPDVSGGPMGKAGKAGNGGVGGPGGAGGESFTWHETTMMSRSVSDGRGGTRLETYSSTTVHSNPGGSRGLQGQTGQDGRTGDDGRAGINGSFQFIVGEMVYQQLYDLGVTVAKIVSARGAADFYEPGEQVHMLATVHNTGAMPTPTQDIEISLQPAAWMERGDFSLVLKEQLPVGGSHTFTTPFSFRIHDQLPCHGEMLKRQEALTFRAHLPSVNKSFSNVSGQKEVITVRYPVELTAIKGKITTVFNEKTTLSLHIQNTSSAGFGIGSPQKRRVFVIFEITEVEAVKSNDVELVTDQIFEEKESQELNKVPFEIGHLPPNRKEFFAVSFRFTNPDLKTRSKVGVTASLYLEHVNLGQVRCIQKRLIEISLSESYRYNPMADLLLVTHSGVTKEELESWDNLLNGMRFAYSIWNASYYKHLDFSKGVGAETLQNHFAGKTVIILNQNPLKDLIPKQEILRMGKNFNIKTYIAGEEIAPKEQCELQRVDITDIAAQTLHGRVFFESNLAKEFESEVKEFAKTLCKSNPTRKYVMVKSFGPQKVDGLFKHALGTVKVCCTGQLNRASVLSVPFNSSDPQMIESPQNRYGILKMLHFERKLLLLESIPKSSRQLLEDAIISDLADEQYVVGQCQWTKEDLPVLKSHLEQLNIFLTTPWKIAENEDLKASVRRVMLQCRAFVNANFNTKTQFHAVAAASEQLIDAGFKAVFGIQDAWQDEYKTNYYEPLSKISSREVLEMTRNPRFKAFYQDNWEGRSQIKSIEDLL